MVFYITFPFKNADLSMTFIHENKIPTELYSVHPV